MKLVALAAALVFAVSIAPAQDWAGKWYSTRGVLDLEQEGAAVKGRWGDKGGTLKGEANGRELTFTLEQGPETFKGTLELVDDGHFFTGTVRESSVAWRGWRKNPEATKGKPAKFGGTWRTSWGLMELEQDGDTVTGGFGAQGWSTFRGEVRGRRLLLKFKAPWGSGTIWWEPREDGAAGYGAAVTDGGEWKFIARRLEGYRRGVKPVAGKIVAGLGDNRLTYYIRAPKGWRKGKKVPAIVFLHGSNMSSKPYLGTIADRRGFGDRYMLIGIDGEQWQDWSKPDDPRHNYTYVNYMGRSTYKGYPNTDRESPALVAELIGELRERWKLTKVFVGGHSQGGYLSYFFLMHSPELVDGVFPISCGLVMQCEPDVFESEELKAAQRATPLAAVHGEADSAVGFSFGKSSYARFEEFGFPAARFFDNSAGHAFIALRFDDAIEWLEQMSSDDPKKLLRFTEDSLDEDRFRDATAAIARLRTLKLKKPQQKQLKELAARVDEYAEADAERYAATIAANEDATWVDGFLEYRRQFEFADAAKPAMAAFYELRESHEIGARELMSEGRGLMRSGQKDAAWNKYDRILEKYYASSLYSRVKGWQAERK